MKSPRQKLLEAGARGVTTALNDFEDRLIDELSTVRLDRFGI
jgi:hypothetical protein